MHRLYQERVNQEGSVMKKGIRFCFILILFAITAAVWADLQINQDPLLEAAIEARREETRDETIDETTLETIAQTKDSNDEITEVPYQQDGYDAVYPNFISGGTQKQLEVWNQIITKDFEKIISIYSFNPLPQPTPSQGYRVPTILKLGYNIKENSDRFLSIFYEAAFRSPYSAHPTDLVYTTNIDKKNNKRIRLGDYIKLDNKFVKDFRTWDFIPFEEGNEEVNKAIRAFISDLSNQELLQGFQAADQIGSANLYNIFSYRTPEKLGISIGVPNYLGDHVEFEKNLADLGEYLIDEE
jgi:hypothetical protein